MAVHKTVPFWTAVAEVQRQAEKVAVLREALMKAKGGKLTTMQQAVVYRQFQVTCRAENRLRRAVEELARLPKKALGRIAL